uniref:Geranylgeranyl reductase n=1 Tax=Arundo donax TaxID=35708 RepID=A0A0A9GJF0_ARUDO
MAAVGSRMRSWNAMAVV